MSVKSLSRIGVVVATVAATGAIAAPSAYAGTVTISSADAGPVLAGGAIKATAVIADVDVPATLQIRLHAGGDCTGGVIGSSQVFGDGKAANGDADPEDVIVMGGGNYNFTVSNIDAGTYSWFATLTEGITEDDEKTLTDCSSNVPVAKATPGLSVAAVNTTAGGSIQAGGTLSNRIKAAPQNGDGTAPWTMRFDLYPPSDTTCSGTPIDTSTRPVYNSVDTYKSDTFKTTSAGTYRWKVTYSGDTNNNKVATKCGSPSSVVTSDGTSPPPPPSSTVKCKGLVANFVGSNRAERIIGSPGPDVIVARGGADIINGNGGKDTICAGAGNDVVRGGAGNDALVGGKGNDRLYGGYGDDNLNGGLGSDRGSGGPGRDTLRSM